VRYKFTTSFADDNARSFLSQFHHFWSENLTVGEVKSEQGSLSVKALHSSRARVEVYSAPGLDTLHKQQMRMTANKDVRFVGQETTANALGVSTRPPTYMGHPNATSFAFDVLVFGECPAHQMIIDVAMHRNKGRHSGQCIGNPKVSDVSGMPYFVTRRKVMQDPFIQVAVGVANKSNSHGTNFVAVVRLAPSWRSA
jgi:hypothetical protein